MTKPSNLLQGTLDLLILRTIQLEPMHGWAIAQQIRLMSKDQLRVGQSALYPALHKLEQQGWIAAEWRVSEKCRRAKYYQLTAAGRKALKTETAQWGRLSAAISRINKAAVGSSHALDRETPSCSHHCRIRVRIASWSFMSINSTPRSPCTCTR